MADVKKTGLAAVIVHREKSELEQFQEFELAAAMVGGELGQSVLTALATVRDDVLGRAL